MLIPSEKTTKEDDLNSVEEAKRKRGHNITTTTKKNKTNKKKQKKRNDGVSQGEPSPHTLQATYKSQPVLVLLSRTCCFYEEVKQLREPFLSRLLSFFSPPGFHAGIRQLSLAQSLHRLPQDGNRISGQNWE